MSYLTPEKRIQNKCIEYMKELELKEYPLIHFRRDAIGPSYKKGLPDLYIVLGGSHIEVEFKKPGGLPRADQERWERRFKNIGCEYWLIDNFDDFKNILDKKLETV